VRVDIVTIFPEYFAALDLSLVGKARARGLLDVAVHDLRDYSDDPHRGVDDAPYGGGPGMVMRPQPWSRALESVTGGPPGGGHGAGGGRAAAAHAPRVVFPTPSGVPFTQRRARELAAQPWLVFCCGRYEGIDRRVLDAWADDEVSLGDYVLAGGEVATLAIVEAVTRLVPGVLGNAASAGDDSFSTGLLEGPVYTRPASFDGRAVPEVLLSGDHAAVGRWRRVQALLLTAARRPDLLVRAALSPEDVAVLEAAGVGVPAEITRRMAQ
jgi:tRNA (guanine37-N1)-methyltransferase